MTRLPRAIGIGIALAATIGLRWTSTVELKPYQTDAAVLRLTWSARPERIETCRPLTESELANVPAHMRQTVVCEGDSASYRLEVRRDGVLILDDVVHGGGWNRDRPMHVFREIAQPAGDVAMRIEFTRIENTSPGENAPRRQDAHVPAVLVLDDRFTFQPGRVVLVTYDADRQGLVAKTP